jgi:7-cyano-7-deazaguanine synthase
MCAIVGALLNRIDCREKALLAENILLYIMLASRARGRDGFGWHMLYQTSEDKWTDFLKDVTRTQHGVQLPILSELNQTLEGAAFIANFRAEPTTEFVKDKRKDDQQPYSNGAWSIVHNGTIANDKELRTFEVGTNIDSASIVEAVSLQGQVFEDHESVYAVFRNTVEQLIGSYAILATHEQFTDQMLVAANYRPVWYIKTDVGVFFASSKEYFPEQYDPIALEPYTTARFYYDNTWYPSQLCKEYFIESHTLYPKLEHKPRALVVASGGMDSTVAAAKCLRDGYEVELIHFVYGCRAQDKEQVAIKQIAKELGVKVTFFPLDIYDPKDSRLFDQDSEIAGGEEGSEFAHEWVPARNLVMLSVATAYAEANKFDYIVLGNNMEEAGAYPDNEPEFIRRFNALLPFAVGANKRVEVLMPVGDLMKHEIVALGHAVNAPLHLTWSCYKNGSLHCGKCGPCYMRRTAFEINGLKEVINYEE